ncbi:MAG: carboxypeptidase regulatory-like domain-containing protein [Planctomycetales bacterium]|nr:carboxypeptidase regulatory-like domain-containing protein [Planctomycetales bacterium]MCA9210831.1 carboxypeptidase regulatory-like domain-containing protein [Planctomycetales bacterium]MCA9220734.1 carboxypeptidase regulatory-like domain-containing protein [Planctomycetales bacterium]
MMDVSWMKLAGLALAIALPTLIGCGSHNVGQVEGRVTLDGEPLPNAMVTFTPVAEGTPSFGVTDEQGNYRLQYTRDTEGAEIGEHLISIRTETSGNPDAEPPIPATPERVPMKFNAQTELRKSVEKGAQTIDLPLDSEGDIAPPGREGEHGDTHYAC